jgi:hypothetical protein
MRRGTPLASLGAWRVTSGRTTPNQSSLEKELSFMALPKYYFQDLPAEVMDEIMQEMVSTCPEPSWEEIDHWLNCQNVASTIPGWFTNAELFRAERA